MPSTMTFEQAEDQIAEHFGFRPRVSIQMDGGKVFQIPNPALLDDDQQDRWDALQFEVERCDRDHEGNPVQPYRTDGVLMKPPYPVRLAIVLWGEDGYREFKAAGGTSNQINLEWARMAREFQDANDQ